MHTNRRGNVKLGKQIWRYRVRKGLTLTQVAALLDVAVSTVWCAENGLPLSIPTAAKFRRLVSGEEDAAA